MTRDEIISMAQEAAIPAIMPFLSEDELQCLEHFAAIVAAAERKECAALRRGHPDVLAPLGHSAWGEAYQDGWIAGTAAYRDAICARGEKGQP